MLVVAFNPGHDGAIAAIRDGSLVLCLEAEKDSFERYSVLNPSSVLHVAEQLGELPDVVALGGWDTDLSRQLEAAADLAKVSRARLTWGPGGNGNAREPASLPGLVGAGYLGSEAFSGRRTTFFGKSVQYFSSSHERSHILAAIGMAPADDCPLQAVLVWEGLFGAFYLVDDSMRIVRTIPVLIGPGVRFGFLFGLCDPSYPVEGDLIRLADSGKLMALAAFGDPYDSDPDVAHVVDELLRIDALFPFPKASFSASPVFNCGVRSELAVAAAAVLTRRIFEVFAEVALHEIPAGIPLRISGGCGLNCDWNAAWRDLGHFSSVFVPPCPNDSGSAIGTAIDAHAAATGSPHIDWDVYAGLEFDHDVEPDPSRWHFQPLDHGRLAKAIADGQVVAWAQGRWEVGPRALGNRSLLAEPFGEATRDRLNDIKGREPYRPIAPCARVEDLGAAFDDDFEDPHMLYFRHVRDRRLAAVTHVDGSARVQTVSASTNPSQHALLSAFAQHTGVGVLCNTSLNFSGRGFINRTSHLIDFCDRRGVDCFVVGDRWYSRRDGEGPATIKQPVGRMSGEPSLDGS